MILPLPSAASVWSAVTPGLRWKRVGSASLAVVVIATLTAPDCRSPPTAIVVPVSATVTVGSVGTAELTVVLPSSAVTSPAASSKSHFIGFL